MKLLRQVAIAITDTRCPWLIRITGHPAEWQLSREVPTVTYGSGRCAEAGLQNHAEVFARLVQLNQRRVVSGQGVA